LIFNKKIYYKQRAYIVKPQQLHILIRTVFTIILDYITQAKKEIDEISIHKQEYINYFISKSIESCNKTLSICCKSDSKLAELSKTTSARAIFSAIGN
jgi:hypothetical protein